MKFSLYNTLSRSIETFEPLQGNTVGVYACGLTVYDYTHLGHLRKYTMDDVLIRTLQYFGYEITFVQNVTDVGHLASDADTGEDKLEKGAKKYGESVFAVARKFEDYFFESMDAMGNMRPTVSCRATEHIQEQLDMVLKLEKRGFTYVIENDGVYFDTSKLDDYGKLARLDIEKLKEGARVDMVQGKRNPTDFALWKFERSGENRAMVWPSPWHERSFPGWHIECSAMSMKYLGDQFDVHTGGIDHIPVHHTNEIAQAEAVTGKKPFVKYWVHHNFLRVEGEKMSKSLGNFFTIDDVRARGYHPKALRLLFLGSHYRSELNFTWESLAGAQKAFERLVKHVSQLGETAKPAQQDSLSSEARELQNRFLAAIADDLHTAEAVALLWEVLKSTTLPDSEKMQLCLFMDTFFGFDFMALIHEDLTTQVLTVSQLPENIQKWVSQRETARLEKNWAEADSLRQKIADAGFFVEDTPKGQELRLLKR